MAKAWLVTHPETALDKQGRIHGHLDPPLSASGRQKAKQIARGFKGKGVKRIRTSPRLRAREMADALGKATGAPISVHPELEPWDMASLSGAKTASVRPVIEFFEKRPNRVIPDGEAKADVLDRYKRFMKTVKPGDVISGHSQHALALNYAQKGGDPAKVSMVGSKSGEVKEVNV